VAADELVCQDHHMGAHIRQVVSAVVIGAATVVALAGCSAGEQEPTRTVTVTATPRALQPGDSDTSVPAVCGQASAVATITFNAGAAHERGALTEEAYRSRLDAARYVYAHLPATDALASSVGALQSWLTQHPTSASSLPLDPEDAGLQDAISDVGTACRDAGSPIGVSAASGG
jgi:hypothetical protein